MPFIAFLGCDGSGKSAVIADLAECLSSGPNPAICGHWRPKAFRISADDNAVITAEDPHGQIPRGCISSCLKLGWLCANWWIGWLRGLRKTSKSGFVLFDRFHGDLLVDPRRYRYGGPRWAARLACRLMPQPDRVFFLDAEPDVLLSRKQEVSKESLEMSRKAYLELCTTHSRFTIIDASRPLEQVVEDIHQQITNLTAHPLK